MGLAGPRERTVTARARFPGKAWARREAEADQAEEGPAEQFQWAGVNVGAAEFVGAWPWGSQDRGLESHRYRAGDGAAAQSACERRAEGESLLNPGNY